MKEANGKVTNSECGEVFFESATLEKLLATHAGRGQGQGADEFGTGDKLDRRKHGSAESESNKGDGGNDKGEVVSHSIDTGEALYPQQQFLLEYLCAYVLHCGLRKRREREGGREGGSM